jgi:hypothetical protein
MVEPEFVRPSLQGAIEDLGHAFGRAEESPIARIDATEQASRSVEWVLGTLASSGVRPRRTSGNSPQPGYPRRQREVHLSAGASLSIARPAERSLGDPWTGPGDDDDQACRFQGAGSCPHGQDG